MPWNPDDMDIAPKEQFDTGSQRDARKGKGRFDLMSPFVEQRDAALLELGAELYGPRNWEKGQPIMRYVDSARRHLNEFLLGKTNEDHLTRARWNLGCIIHTLEMIDRNLLPASLDDRPKYERGPDDPKDPFGAPVEALLSAEPAKVVTIKEEKSADDRYLDRLLGLRGD